MAGLGVMLLATALNIGLTGMSPAEKNSLPRFLSVPYEWGGQLGVTVAVICVGFGVIAVGLVGELLARRHGRRGMMAARQRAMADALAPSQNGFGSSSMTLVSEKYLSGWAPHDPEPELEVGLKCESDYELPHTEGEAAA